ncbi:MAG: hypothetical protein LKM43_03595 [Wolbachia endosymbiont of Penenirmus auritus]|nr:hypothetical protein [Wolbachia endosymbiont of Penenirmus auritus]
MPNDNDNSKGWIPSKRYERYNGPNKDIREQYKREMQKRESSKPDTRLGDSSSTGAGSSRGKNS